MVVLKTFKNKELGALWGTGKSKIDARFHERILILLDRMDASAALVEMSVPGFNFHSLKGKPQSYCQWPMVPYLRVRKRRLSEN